LEQEELYRLCGIADLPPQRTGLDWVNAKLRFLGADGYVLGTKCVEVCLRQRNGGFSLSFKEALDLPANVLMGAKSIQGTLYDVEVVMQHGLVLSMAKLCEGRYPMILRNGEMVCLT